MKAPTSLLILPPEHPTYSLPPSLLHITPLPLHFFTLTLLYSCYPLTLLPSRLSSYSFPLVTIVMCCPSLLCCPSPVCVCVCVCVYIRAVHLMRPSRASNLVRLFVSFHLARLCLYYPLSNSSVPVVKRSSCSFRLCCCVLLI